MGCEPINETEDTTWQPLFGYKSDHALAEIDDDGKKFDRGTEDDDSVSYEIVRTEEDKTKAARAKGSPNIDIRVTHINDTKIPRGVGHSATCRSRIRDLI